MVLSQALISIHFSIFFFNDTATTEIYTLSLHDALPICVPVVALPGEPLRADPAALGTRAGLQDVEGGHADGLLDRKSTRLNSSHANISYAVFCLKKKNHVYNHPVEPVLTDDLCHPAATD